VDLQGNGTLIEEMKLRRANGGDLYLMNVKQGLWKSLDKCGWLDASGGRNVFQSKTAAIHGIYQKLDKSICAQCKRGVFNECGSSSHKT
jgi:SulP family sulfate permease